MKTKDFTCPSCEKTQTETRKSVHANAVENIEVPVITCKPCAMKLIRNGELVLSEEIIKGSKVQRVLVVVGKRMDMLRIHLLNRVSKKNDFWENRKQANLHSEKSNLSPIDYGVHGSY